MAAAFRKFKKSKFACRQQAITASTSPRSCGLGALKKRIRAFLKRRPYDHRALAREVGGLDRRGRLTSEFLVAFAEVLADLVEKRNRN
jgi:hypothetical protein